MNNIEPLVNNFISIARERLFILVVFAVIVVGLKLAPKEVFFILCANISLHAVQMFLVNKSFQSQFIEQPKFTKLLEILDGWSLALFLVAIFLILFSMVLI